MTGVTHNHLPPCSARAAGDWLWITPCLIIYREKRTSAALLLLKSCFLSSSKKRTYHLLQNRTFLFAIDSPACLILSYAQYRDNFKLMIRHVVLRPLRILTFFSQYYLLYAYE